MLAQICSVIYFAFFLTMPIWSSMDKTKPVPERVTMDGGIGPLGSLGGLALILVVAFVPLKVVGAESNYDCGTIPCDEFDADPRDKPSLQNGAKLYMNYCMGCHSLQYARYTRMASDLGIPEDLVMENLVHDPEKKIGDLMTNAMPRERAKVWFGAAPPDLTLIARSRQPDWLYTYLRTFYRDDTRPYGVNNLVYPNVGMPHALLSLQGLPECTSTSTGDRIDPLSGEGMDSDPCGALEVAEAGAMGEEEFDGAVYDLVNFLAYTGEPMLVDRQRIGIYSLLFIAVFFVFAWLLNREYWKDIH